MRGFAGYDEPGNGRAMPQARPMIFLEGRTGDGKERYHTNAIEPQTADAGYISV